MAVVAEFQSPYGLSGGGFLTGSASISGSGNFFYAYYPIENSVATISFANITNGGTLTRTFTAGIPVYGKITNVNQASGASFVYSCVTDIGDNV